MSRRPALRENDLRTAIQAMRAEGLVPTAMEVRPDGTTRWCFTETAVSDDDEADRALEEWARKHGYR